MRVQRSSVGKGVVSLDSILFVTLLIKKLNYSLLWKLCMFDYPMVACLLANILVQALYGNTSFFLYKRYPWYPVNASTVDAADRWRITVSHCHDTGDTGQKTRATSTAWHKSVFNSIFCGMRGLLSSLDVASSRKGNARSGWLTFNEK